jgi:hypothetical protein
MVVTLTIPSEASTIRLARLVASGFASQLGATVADLDDVRTVVDELCSLLVGHAEAGDEIMLRLSVDGSILRATASAPLRGAWQPDELAEGIVQVLADSYEVIVTDGHVDLAVQKVLEPVEA